MKSVEVLKNARALIEKPENWTTKWFAKDVDGEDTGSTSENAVCWCASGAMTRAIADLNAGEPYPRKPNFRPHGILIKEMEGNIPKFNDTHTHEQVLAAFDKAIATAEA